MAAMEILIGFWSKRLGTGRECDLPTLIYGDFGYEIQERWEKKSLKLIVRIIPLRK